MSQVVFYLIKRRIDLTVETPGVANWNLPMNVSEFKIYTGVTNNIEFTIRDIDRKPVPLIGRTLVVTIVDPETQQVILRQHCIPVDDQRGIARLAIQPDDADDWALGFKTYTVTVHQADGQQNMLYLNQVQSARGQCEVMIGPVPGPKPSYVVLPDRYVPERQNVILNQVYYTPALPGNEKSGNKYAIQTVAMYLNQFIGTIQLQGTLDDQAPQDPHSWFVIPMNGQDSLEFPDPTTEILAYSFEMNLQWFRVMFYPDPILLQQQYPVGTIDKILFRN